MYMKDRRKRLAAATATATINPNSPSPSKDDELGDNVIALTSMFKKSTRLFLSRGVGLICSSSGAAIGTLVWPGWGTLIVSNMGEGFAGVVFDADGPQPFTLHPSSSLSTSMTKK